LGLYLFRRVTDNPEFGCLFTLLIWALIGLMLQSGKGDNSLLELKPLGLFVYALACGLATVPPALNNIMSIGSKLFREGGLDLKAVEATGYFEQGDGLVRGGNYDKAIQVYSEAIRKDLQPATANYKIGEIYCHQLKDYELAVDHYNKVFGLAPDNDLWIATRFRLSDMYLSNLKDREMAKMHLRLIVDNFPTSKAANFARMRLEALGDKE
jgi:pentatricopeptide repeat protein